MKKVHAMNNMQLMMVNHSTLFAFKIPAGISRMAVLGFLASKDRSRYLLNAMAALRANTIQPITSNNLGNTY
jgi:hypothetical protein